MKPKIIALCGKGGVGKTSISALLVKLLIENGSNKVLAIDADPAIGLATSLGFEAGKSVDMIRNDLIARLEEGTQGATAAVAEQMDYDLLDAIEERDNLAFLAIGRPEKEGCYCKINSVLRDLISSLSQGFDYVVIDGEAGIEQVNRRVMETVDHLILVSDLSKKGLNVANAIAQLAEKAVHCETKGLIINRTTSKELNDNYINLDLQLYGCLPEDNQIRQADILGQSLLSIPDSNAYQKLIPIVQAFIQF